MAVSLLPASPFARLAVTLALALAAGCARAAPSALTPAAPERAPPAPPADLSPNVRRDRRAEPGVRAPAKPLVLGDARSVKCGKLVKGRPGDEAPLLGGRLLVRAPAGAKPPSEVARGRLAPAPPPEEASRLVTDAGRISLAIVAKETFQLDPDLYEPEADAPAKPGTLDVEAPRFLKAAFPGEEGLEITPVEIGAGRLRAYAARPPEPNAPAGKDTALVLGLLLAQEDGTLASVSFYVRGETVRNATGPNLVGCTRLAERIAETLAPGPRRLERAPGRRHVADVSDDEELAVTVPADYVAVPAAGGSRLFKLRPLSLYAGSISVSIVEGGAGAVPEGADASAPGTILGHPVAWRGRTTPRGGFLFAAPPLDAHEARTAEILVKATRQAKALEEMRGIAETLAIVKRGAR